MTKITLNNIASLIDATTAVNTINANNSTVQTAMDNTVSRDGTQPNSMNTNLDMNSKQILNLPAPATNNSPLRLSDLSSFTGGGTISTVPTGGTTGQILAKNSNTNYDMLWENLPLTAGNNISVTGNTISTVNNPNFTTSVTTPTLNVGSGVITGTTGSGGSSVLATSPTITTPVISSITNGGTLTLPNATDTLVARTTTDTLTNKTLTNPVLVTPTLGAATATTVAFSPTTGGIIGTTTNDNASAGNVGEYVASTVGSTSITTTTQTNITTISLTAGDWDVYGEIEYLPAATTNITDLYASISLTSATLDQTTFNYARTSYTSAGIVPGASKENIIKVGPRRVSISSTTTIYLVGFADFTVSTLNTLGGIRARRIR